jgi:tetratricopeptide (TPR) repeat protein
MQKNTAAEILVKIGGWQRGLNLLKKQAGDYWGRVLNWVGYAEKLLELGETQAADDLLSEALQSVDQLPPGRHQQAYQALAVGMAKAGRREDALAIAGRLLGDSRELVKAEINQYVQHTDNHRQALALVAEARAMAKRMEAGKLRASRQHRVLEQILALGEFELAWEVLGLLVDTLEQTPAFSKHEFRAGDVVETLLPYVETHPRIVYGFITDLLRRDAGQSYWQTVHGVSATLSLMMAMGGDAPLLDLAGFLADWPAGERED